MFGLKKEKKGFFEFDLEKELKADPSKGRAILTQVNEKVFKIKELLRSGAVSENFDDFGILLHGFTALQRVLNRIINKK
jgi:hypothetical protein